jgi:NADPH:quinone reductase-like Zn-dependent oxidoreductase
LPQSQVIGVRTHLSWAELAAVPESFGTAWGSLATLDLRAGQTLLVHGGTSSVGMAAITLAKARGLRVVATTRQERKRATLEANGTDEVVVGTGAIANDVHRVAPDGVDGVLELVGPTAILDAFETLRPGGAVCMTGILEGTWDETHAREVASERGIAYHRFSSTSVINRDTYGSIFQSIVDDIERRRYRLNLDRRFAFDDIAEAHRYMEADRASGKVVVMT